MDEKEKKENKSTKMSEEERRRRLERMRREKARQRKRKAMMMRGALAGGLVLVLVLVIAAVALGVKKGKQDKAEALAQQEQAQREEEERQKQLDDKLAEAQRLAAGYDYDGAIELLQTLAEDGKMSRIKSMSMRRPNPRWWRPMWKRFPMCSSIFLWRILPSPGIFPVKTNIRLRIITR
jgi:uncharacterized protein HemX